MSELEKAQAAIEAERKKAQEAIQRFEQLQSERVNDGRRSAFIEAVRANGGSDESNLHILVSASMGDEFSAVFDDGAIAPDESRMSAFIKSVQSKFPKYFGTSGAGESIIVRRCQSYIPS